MALVQIEVDWADAPADCAASLRAVYVRCRRQPDDVAKKTFLRLELLQGRRLWRTDVHEKQKPAVLDCSAAEYLDVLERCFTMGAATAKERDFTYKWSTGKSTLTLMESTGSGFAMKYAALGFTEVVDEQLQTQNWQEILHDVVVKSQHSHSETSRQRQRISELEAMLTAKDKLLETALTAKQRVEDELFSKFCAVLNAKKEEIERLQQDVTMAQTRADGASSMRATAAKKRVAAPGGRKKKVGAKLKKKADSSDEENEDENAVSDLSEEEEEEEDDEDDDGDSDADGSPKKKPSSTSRVTRGAIQAYSQLASQLKTPSQVCAAADVLDDLDAIIKEEAEQDDEQTVERSGRTRKRMAPPSVASTGSRSPQKKIKSSPTQPAPTRKEPPRTLAKAKPAPPPKKAIDSDEEDILDMLS